jgi:hypothetical protein
VGRLLGTFETFELDAVVADGQIIFDLPTSRLFRCCRSSSRRSPS